MTDNLPAQWAIVGRGRLGTALAAALGDAGLRVEGPLGRGADAAGADAVLLCVPDGEIAAAAASLAPGPLVGHCSGALGLDVLDGREAFGLHPLMTVTAAGADFTGAGCAVAGTTARALAAAHGLARCLGMRAFEIADEDRGAYHAAASIASNFLVTLEAAAERLAATTGAGRDLLAPLVRATVENWVAHGSTGALTGPIARGDEATVQRQRDAVAARAPEFLSLFDALAVATRRLARIEAARDPGPMRTIRTVSDLRAALAASRAAGQRIALVPTMGALHEGHLSLIRRARAEANVVVVSLFVNPTQFRPGEDLASYPRDEARDAALAEAEGADLLFAPSVEEVYPDGFATDVRVTGPLTERLEGEARGPDHFHGVTTVVAKLFDIVAPHAAYFGAKDAQQALVIGRMVRDLHLRVDIVTCPTVREPDGLAMSSRNAYLDPADRERAVALRRGLDAAEASVAAGERDPARVAAAGRAAMAEFGVEPEYFEIVSTEDLSPPAAIDGEALVAVAARFGRARLIDNTTVRTPARVAAGPHEHERREAQCSV
jgi:pantoate--beta-alanine ligase